MAVGTGRALYVTTSVAAAPQKTAQVVAFDLGLCGTTLAYRAIEWFFPQYGQTFDRRNYVNICTGQYVIKGKDSPPVPGYAGSADPPEVIRVETDLAPSIVSINATQSVPGNTHSVTATGIIISSSGLVLAEGSSTYGATSLTASVMSSRQSYPAAVVGSDRRQDITVLRLRGASGLQPIRPGSPGKLAPGTDCIALGSASNSGGPLQEVRGSITALNRTVLLSGVLNDILQGILQTNAPNTYNGWPLATTTGDVIGMNLVGNPVGSTGYVSSNPHTGFAIPISKALAIAERIAGGTGSA
jgi:S1-C subfamily serine protease